MMESTAEKGVGTARLLPPLLLLASCWSHTSASPVSSITSRTAHCTSVSPSSKLPPAHTTGTPECITCCLQTPPLRRAVLAQ
jgi:hypothetical protein